MSIEGFGSGRDSNRFKRLGQQNECGSKIVINPPTSVHSISHDGAASQSLSLEFSSIAEICKQAEIVNRVLQPHSMS